MTARRLILTRLSRAIRRKRCVRLLRQSVVLLEPFPGRMSTQAIGQAANAAKQQTRERRVSVAFLVFFYNNCAND